MNKLAQQEFDCQKKTECSQYDDDMGTAYCLFRFEEEGHQTLDR